VRLRRILLHRTWSWTRYSLLLSLSLYSSLSLSLSFPSFARERERERKRERLNRVEIQVFTIPGPDDRPTRNFHSPPGFATVNHNDGTWRISRYDAAQLVRASGQTTWKKRERKEKGEKKRSHTFFFCVWTHASATCTQGTKTSVIFEGTKRASPWRVVSRTRTVRFTGKRCRCRE